MQIFSVLDWIYTKFGGSTSVQVYNDNLVAKPNGIKHYQAIVYGQNGNHTSYHPLEPPLAHIAEK